MNGYWSFRIRSKTIIIKIRYNKETTRSLLFFCLNTNLLRIDSLGILLPFTFTTHYFSALSSLIISEIRSFFYTVSHIVSFLVVRYSCIFQLPFQKKVGSLLFFRCYLASHTTFVLSCFVSKCKTRGSMMQYLLNRTCIRNEFGDQNSLILLMIFFK